jgi:hypothetical protein
MYDFSYTHRLSEVATFSSDWVKDVYYAERAKELLVETKAGSMYTYSNVPPYVYNDLVLLAKQGGSVGSRINTLKGAYGPGTQETHNLVPFGDVKVEAVPAPTVTVPKAIKTEVQFELDGQVKFMKSTKPADEALSDYLVSVESLGLNAELQAVHVYFKE